MNTLRKILGPVWILLGPAAIIFMIYEAIKKIAEKPTQDVYLPWIIIITIFTPIAIALVIFGYYALKGEYDLGDSSDK
jgi:ABC-type polysaccharide/polyol phosphate export permease